MEGENITWLAQIINHGGADSSEIRKRALKAAHNEGDKKAMNLMMDMMELRARQLGNQWRDRIGELLK